MVFIPYLRPRPESLVRLPQESGRDADERQRHEGQRHHGVVGGVAALTVALVDGGKLVSGNVKCNEVINGCKVLYVTTASNGQSKHSREKKVNMLCPWVRVKIE